MSAYPDAKVVLTVRSPESWYDSVHGSIYQFYKISGNLAVRIFLRLTGQLRAMDTVNRISCHPPKGFKKGKFKLSKRGGLFEHPNVHRFRGYETPLTCYEIHDNNQSLAEEGFFI